MWSNSCSHNKVVEHKTQNRPASKAPVTGATHPALNIQSSTSPLSQTSSSSFFVFGSVNQFFERGTRPRLPKYIQLPFPGRTTSQTRYASFASRFLPAGILASICRQYHLDDWKPECAGGSSEITQRNFLYQDQGRNF